MIKLDKYWGRIKDGHLEELLRGAFGFLNIRLIGIGFTYAYTIYVSRTYGAAILGVFSICLAVLKISEICGKVGLDNALLRFVAQYTAQNRKDLARRVYFRAIKTAFITSFFIGVFIYFAAPYMALYIFHNTHLTIPLRIISLIVLPASLIELNASYLRGFRLIKSYSFFLNTSHFLFGIIIIIAGKRILAANTAPVAAYAIATAITIIISIIMVMVIGKSIKKTPDKPGDAIKTKELLRISFPMLLTGSFSFFLQYTGTLALGILTNNTKVGIYHAVLRLASLISFTLTSINSIAASKFSECYSTNDMDGFRRVTYHSTRLIFWTTIPPGIAFILFPTTFAGLFGKEITGGVTALIILVIGFFVNSICGPVGTILNMTGHQVFFQYVMFAAAIINIIANIFLIPIFSINGAAIANTISMITWNVVSAIYVKRKFGISTIYIPYFTEKKFKKDIHHATHAGK